MMRSASFYFLSVALHAVVLAYPVSFVGRNHVETIRVTILPLESQTLGDGGGGSANPGRKTPPHSHLNSSHAAATSFAVKSVNSTPEPKVPTAEKIATINESSVTLSSAVSESSDKDATTYLVSTSSSTLVSATGGTGTGGHGFGAGVGSGSGNGAGPGSGDSAKGAALTQARYRDTPRPEYPDNARRQGREGRVLLRVFVDDQGETRAVEVSRSSGTDALDNAATSAIKRWRFYPARSGDRPIESWVNVPIDFRLTDIKN
jgi:TonB family protein